VSRSECFRSALAAATALPGVEAVGLAQRPPVTSSLSWISLVTLRPETVAPSGGVTYYYANAASPAYFRTLRIPLLAGRLFQESDGLDAPPVVILSRSAARQVFGAADPLGQRVITGLAAHSGAWPTVVGVVGDVRHQGYQKAPQAEVYQPVAQAAYSETSVVARSRIDPAALAPALRHAVQLADPAGKIPSVKRMDEMLSDSVTQRRQRTYLLGAFAALSLLVAMVGVYGVVAYSVARRTHEIGVRMALGAQPGDVLRMVLGEGLKLALAGAALGLALTLWLSRALASFLFGVGPRDALTFAAASAILTVAVCVASYLPSRQATRVDPATALRRE
jgi:putative ABC transport system permease protein